MSWLPSKTITATANHLDLETAQIPQQWANWGRYSARLGQRRGGASSDHLKQRRSFTKAGRQHRWPPARVSTIIISLLPHSTHRDGCTIHPLSTSELEARRTRTWACFSGLPERWVSCARVKWSLGSSIQPFLHLCAEPCLGFLQTQSSTLRYRDKKTHSLLGSQTQHQPGFSSCHSPD